jgi:hypothetical protein
MRAVMRNHEIEKEFQQQGYVEIPFISEDEVEALKQKFFDLLPASGGNLTPSDNGMSGNEITYDFTFIDKNIEYKRAVFEVITAYFKPHVEKWIADYRPIIANYIRKKTAGGEVPLHQNWAFADEMKCSTISIWCPLVDSFEENGTLQVVPKSHKKFGRVRGPMIPWELEGIKQDIIDNYLVPCNVKAGNAIVLDDSIVHYSAINKTGDLRLAIQLILIPAEISSLHYHVNPSADKNKVEVLDVDTEFYMQFNPWMKPSGATVMNSFHHEPGKLSIGEFDEILKGKRFDEEPNPGFFARLKEMITN